MSELAVVPRRHAADLPSSSAPGSVLIIDDEAAIRESLETLLQLEGYEVETAASGEEGLVRLGDRAFDLVLLDLALPGRNGLDNRTAWYTSRLCPVTPRYVMYATCHVDNPSVKAPGHFRWRPLPEISA